MQGDKLVDFNLQSIAFPYETNTVLLLKKKIICFYFKDAKLLFEPPHEKTNNLHMRKKDADQLRGNREADQSLCFRF